MRAENDLKVLTESFESYKTDMCDQNNRSIKEKEELEAKCESLGSQVGEYHQGSRMRVLQVLAVLGSSLTQRAASLKIKNIFSGFLCANCQNCTLLSSPFYLG